MLVKENLPKVSLKKTTPSAFIIGEIVIKNENGQESFVTQIKNSLNNKINP